ncbi:MAG TPA: hypothetical protein P5022_01770, partial [Candidatus Paceibacterota bacterium]|nr:hypothetical protein [Candidatus Paceibacterota bacterium]
MAYPRRLSAKAALDQHGGYEAYLSNRTSICQGQALRAGGSRLGEPSLGHGDVAQAMDGAAHLALAEQGGAA